MSTPQMESDGKWGGDRRPQDEAIWILVRVLLWCAAIVLLVASMVPELVADVV